MKLAALSHLLLSGAQSVGDLARLLRISSTYASQITNALVDHGFVIKERMGKKVIVRPNMESPFVRNFSKFVVVVGAYPPYTPADLLEPESKRKIIWQLRIKGKSIKELRKSTGYSRTIIYDALRPFLRTNVVSVSNGREKDYDINSVSPLTEPLFQLIEFFESEIDLRPLLEKISANEKVIALSVFGSQIVGEKDKISDVDALVVVASPKDRSIVKEYVHSKLQLNVYSRRGIVQLVRKEPWFLRLALDGKILKGKDFLEGLESLPTTADFSEIISEIKEMLDNLDRLSNKEKARVMMYCIRTSVAMRLFLDKQLDQKKFINELHRRYPEFGKYREYDRDRKIETKTIRSSIKKILEDLRYVEEKKEKER